MRGLGTLVSRRSRLCATREAVEAIGTRGLTVALREIRLGDHRVHQDAALAAATRGAGEWR